MHEGMIDRIDKDVNHAVLNVNKGKENLMKHYDNVKSNKGLFIRVKLIIIHLKKNLFLFSFRFSLF